MTCTQGSVSLRCLSLLTSLALIRHHPVVASSTVDYTMTLYDVKNQESHIGGPTAGYRQPRSNGFRSALHSIARTNFQSPTPIRSPSSTSQAHKTPHWFKFVRQDILYYRCESGIDWAPERLSGNSGYSHDACHTARA
jgi:hypothetical protein